MHLNLLSLLLRLHDRVGNGNSRVWGRGRKNSAFHFSPVYSQAAMFSRRLNKMTALHPFATELEREGPSFEHKLPGEN